ncbi:uncharacterized protein MELLADRAFT_108793 [Melampsora larici-populina 98AG31]|uniref:Uncharacterized protein n=1 Tax=Melampsora larici-populina (strain 98AG31 / pathotype 3-4-7) TaxID=747676 RepID=F4RU98_MELLP|nr:uncharacterized protein MELLADRAFT_108793 [Melampsora larici-populina 98AG31]EGG04037.1 hypothetical protein MELLADRAFT_108793 [Melampsora larici-populina 98AG31]
MKSYQIWISYYLFMIYTLINLSTSHPLSLIKENGLLDIKKMDHQLSCSESHDQINNLSKGDQFHSADLKRENEVVRPSPSGVHISKPNKIDEAPGRMEDIVAPKDDDLMTLKDQLKKDEQTAMEKSNNKELKKTWLRKTLELILLPYKSIKGILKWVGNRIHSLRNHSNEPIKKLVKDPSEEKKMIKKINRCEFDEFKEESNSEKTHLNEVDEIERSELIGSKGEGIIAAMRHRKKYATAQNSMLSKLSRPDDEMKTIIHKENEKKENLLDMDGRFLEFNRKRKQIEENDELIQKQSKSFLDEKIENKSNQLSTSTDQIKLSNLFNQGKGLMKSTFGDDGYIRKYAKKCSNLLERLAGDDEEMFRKYQEEEKGFKKGLNQIQHFDQLHLTIEEPLIDIHDELNQFSLKIKLPMFKELKMNQYDDFLSILAKNYQFRLIEEEEKEHQVTGPEYGSTSKQVLIDVHTKQRSRAEGVLEHPLGIEIDDPFPNEIIRKKLDSHDLSTNLQFHTENKIPKSSSDSLIKSFYPNSLMSMWKRHQKMRALDPLYAFVTLKKDLLMSKYHWFVNKFNKENQSGSPIYKVKNLAGNQISEITDLKMSVEHELAKSSGMSGLEGFEKWPKTSSTQIPQSESVESFSPTIDPIQNLLGKFGEIFKSRVMKTKDMRVDLGLSKLKGNLKSRLTNIFKSKKDWFRGKDVVPKGKRNGYTRERLDQARRTINRVLGYQKDLDGEKDFKSHNEIVPHIIQQEKSNEMRMITAKNEIFDWANALKSQRDKRAREVSNKLILPLFTILKDKTSWLSSEMDVWKLKVLKKVLHPQKLNKEPKLLLTLPSPQVKQPKKRKISKVNYYHETQKKIRVNRVLNSIQSSDEKEKVEKEEQEVKETTGDIISDAEEIENQNEGNTKSWRLSYLLSPIIKDRVEFFEKLKEINQ